jgi:hypothetical protein
LLLLAGERIIIPSEMRSEILQIVHESHLGIDKFKSVGPKLKFYLFPLTLPTLKNCPYPENFIEDSHEFFFSYFVGSVRRNSIYFSIAIGRQFVIFLV